MHRIINYPIGQRNLHRLVGPAPLTGRSVFRQLQLPLELEIAVVSDSLARIRPRNAVGRGIARVERVGTQVRISGKAVVVEIATVFQVEFTSTYSGLAGGIYGTLLSRHALRVIFYRRIQTAVFGIADIVCTVIAVITKVVVQVEGAANVNVARLGDGAGNLIHAQRIVRDVLAAVRVFVAGIIGAIVVVFAHNRLTVLAVQNLVAGLNAIAVLLVVAKSIVRRVGDNVVLFVA